jgi:excisionase family DNA binding protein
MHRVEIGTEVALDRWRERLQSRNSKPPARHARQSPLAPVAQPRTIAEAATELGLSVHTIRTWVAARRIAHIRLGRVIRIPASEISRLIEENTVPAIKER